MKTKLDRIIKNELCLGCGLCESIGKEIGYSMELKRNGFYYPKLPTIRDKSIEKEISEVCPGINITGSYSKTVWGDLKSAQYAWSNDPVVRKKGSSGGVISSICIYLLENEIVNGVLHVGNDKTHFLHNKLFISRTKEEVLSNASSRYAPALVLNEFFQILESSDETYCFVGKPCDILAVKNYFTRNNKYQDRIKYYLALFCAGIPSYNATLDLLKQSGQKDNPDNLKYRGEGWPGNFEAKYKDDSEFKVSYRDSWGKVLGRQVHFRCKICPDAIGLLADFSIGDAWETIDGYPDFEEKPGRSFILVRNEKGHALIQTMIKNRYITAETLDLENLSKIQAYQYQRRIYAGYRLLPINIISGFLFKLKGLQFVYLMKQLSVFKGLKSTLGVLKRSFNRNNYYNRNNY